MSIAALTMTSEENAFFKALEKDVDSAVRQIPPLWPLASSVAVNPFLGQSGEDLASTAARLERVGGVRVILPRSWYLERIETGAISDQDLLDALQASPHASKPENIEQLKHAAGGEPQTRKLPTIADLAARAGQVDWPEIINECFGNWASGYFDQGQALWAAPRGADAWAAWRAWATHDLTPEILGLNDFGTFVDNLPDRPLRAMAAALDRMGLPIEARETYFHQLLLSLGGWSQYARFELWREELAEEGESPAHEFLAIRMAFEEALYLHYEDQIAEAWEEVRAAHATPLAPNSEQIIDAILQEAADRANQRELASTLSETPPNKGEGRPELQAAFCIDVRSEVYRRALESLDPGIETIGFAGFFGVFAEHRDFASDIRELRLPVLLNPTVTSRAGPDDEETLKKDRSLRYLKRAKRAWGRFKLAAVSSFAFVEAAGPVYIGKLLRGSLGWERKALPGGPAPELDPPLDLAEKVDAAERVLRAMSLTSGFARVVLLFGHGANVVNNPHASALQCGACGGYSGEVNARLLASLLNDREVREGLAVRGIEVPEDTVFIGGLHDTTTDRVVVYEQDLAGDGKGVELEKIRAWLSQAGELTRSERALRLPRASAGADVPRRSRNWAEVRPEWGLAGCRAFIAAPRERTAGRDLAGRAFLHDYDWRLDEANGFSVLELIMTAPVVVASWISLQYYGSTVAPSVFGAGNKLLHNVVGGLGVLEGNGGVLRGGLPWQSVHDGERFIHEPTRLSVCIEAPVEAITDVLRNHPDVKALFDNRWLHLFAMESSGNLSNRYLGDLAWENGPDVASADAA